MPFQRCRRVVSTTSRLLLPAYNACQPPGFACFDVVELHEYTHVADVCLVVHVETIVVFDAGLKACTAAIVKGMHHVVSVFPG